MGKEKDNLLTYKQKQKILYLDNTPKEELINWGKLYLEKDLIYDAFEFFKVADDKESLKSLMRLAKSEGNFFLFSSIANSLKQAIADSEWDEIGKQAFEKEKYEFALKAFEKSKNMEKINKIKEIFTPPKEEIDEDEEIEEDNVEIEEEEKWEDEEEDITN